MDAPQDAVLQLSPDERLRLIERLWDSLVQEPGDKIGVSPELRAELDRRLEAHQARPDETLSWSELRARVRNP